MNVMANTIATWVPNIKNKHLMAIGLGVWVLEHCKFLQFCCISYIRFSCYSIVCLLCFTLLCFALLASPLSLFVSRQKKKKDGYDE